MREIGPGLSPQRLGLEIGSRLERRLAALEHREDTEALFAICPRARPALDAVKEVRALSPERLARIQRNHLGFAFLGNGVVLLPADRVRIEQQFVLLFQIVEDRHFAITHHDELLLLEGMKP